MVAAAELRAAGGSWAAVGRMVHRHADTCRRWPTLYPAAWNRIFCEAVRQLRENAAGEAVTVLRNLLRSKDEKVCRDAARALLAAGPPPTPAEKSDCIDDYMNDLDDRDQQALETNLDAIEADDGPAPDGGCAPRPA